MACIAPKFDIKMLIIKKILVVLCRKFNSLLSDHNALKPGIYSYNHITGAKILSLAWGQTWHLFQSHHKGRIGTKGRFEK